MASWPNGYEHTLDHDLESVFYVVIWFGLLLALEEIAKGPKDSDATTMATRIKDTLDSWRKGKPGEICSRKQEFIEIHNPAMLSHIRKGVDIRVYLKRLHDEYLHEYMAAYNKQTADDIAFQKFNRAAAEEARRKALAEGQSERDARKIYLRVQEEANSKKKENHPMPPISFKKWMEAAERTIAQRHYGCWCCKLKPE